MQSAHVTGFICSKLVCISVKCQQKVSQIKPAKFPQFTSTRHCVPKRNSSRMEKLNDVCRHQNEPIDCLG